MIKTFCDLCTRELSGEENVVQNRIRCEKVFEGETKIHIEIQVGKNGTWNSGEVCKDCVIDLINSFDKRPRQV